MSRKKVHNSILRPCNLDALWEKLAYEHQIFYAATHLSSKSTQHKLDPVIRLIFPLHGLQVCFGFCHQPQLPSTLFAIVQTAEYFVCSAKMRYERKYVRLSLPKYGHGRVPAPTRTTSGRIFTLEKFRNVPTPRKRIKITSLGTSIL